MNFLSTAVLLQFNLWPVYARSISLVLKGRDVAFLEPHPIDFVYMTNRLNGMSVEGFVVHHRNIHALLDG
jgi:hypothetical protein